MALTRRTAAELAEAAGPRDPTLARHIYDLHIIRNHFDVAEVASLARKVVRQDAEVFGNQFPAYRENPTTETRRAIDALASDPRYEQRYAGFQRDMVYGDRPNYKDSLQTTLEIARGFDSEK